MAYPEPIPILRQKDAREFIKRLKGFRLTRSQREFYKDARKEYLKAVQKE